MQEDFLEMYSQCNLYNNYRSYFDPSPDNAENLIKSFGF